MNELKDLLIESTPKTPQIELNHLTGDLIIEGKSIPENAAKVYEPVLNWVTRYISEPKPKTNIRLNLEYFNTASAIWLAKILKELIKIKDSDYIVIVHLYFPLEEFEEMSEFDDIKESFAPIQDILHGAIPSIGIKLYGTDEKGKAIKETLVLI